MPFYVYDKKVILDIPEDQVDTVKATATMRGKTLEPGVRFVANDGGNEFIIPESRENDFPLYMKARWGKDVLKGEDFDKQESARKIQSADTLRAEKYGDNLDTGLDIFGGAKSAGQSASEKLRTLLGRPPATTPSPPTTFDRPGVTPPPAPANAAEPPAPGRSSSSMPVRDPNSLRQIASDAGTAIADTGRQLAEGTRKVGVNVTGGLLGFNAAISKPFANAFDWYAERAGLKGADKDSAFQKYVKGIEEMSGLTDAALGPQSGGERMTGAVVRGAAGMAPLVPAVGILGPTLGASALPATLALQASATGDAKDFAKAIVEGYTMHGIGKVAGAMPVGLQRATAATGFGGLTAAGGGDLQDVAASATLGGLLPVQQSRGSAVADLARAIEGNRAAAVDRSRPPASPATPRAMPQGDLNSEVARGVLEALVADQAARQDVLNRGAVPVAEPGIAPRGTMTDAQRQILLQRQQAEPADPLTVVQETGRQGPRGREILQSQRRSAAEELRAALMSDKRQGPPVAQPEPATPAQLTQARPQQPAAIETPPPAPKPALAPPEPVAVPVEAAQPAPRPTQPIERPPASPSGQPVAAREVTTPASPGGTGPAVSPESVFIPAPKQPKQSQRLSNSATTAKDVVVTPEGKTGQQVDDEVRPRLDSVRAFNNELRAVASSTAPSGRQVVKDATGRAVVDNNTPGMIGNATYVESRYVGKFEGWDAAQADTLDRAITRMEEGKPLTPAQYRALDRAKSAMEASGETPSMGEIKARTKGANEPVSEPDLTHGSLVWKNGEWMAVDKNPSETSLIDGKREVVKPGGETTADYIVTPESPEYMDAINEWQAQEAKRGAAPAPAAAEPNPLLAETESVRPKVRGETAVPQAENPLSELAGARRAGEAERAQGKMNLDTTEPPTRKEVPRGQEGKQRQAKGVLTPAAKEPAAATPPAAPAAPSEPMTVAKYLDTTTTGVKLKLPTDGAGNKATHLRITDAQGRTSDVTIDDVQKGENALAGTGVAKVQAVRKVGKNETVLPGKVEIKAGSEPGAPQNMMKRHRGVFNKGGAIGMTPAVRLRTNGTTPADAAQAMFDAQDKAVEAKMRTTFGKLRDRIAAQFVAADAPLRRRLLENNARDVVMERDLSLGASAEALRQYEAASERIYATVPAEYDQVFNRLLQAYRTVEVSNLPGRSTASPGGLGSAENQAYIDAVRAQMPRAWPSLERAVNEYHATMADTVRALRAEGLIDAALETKLLTEHKHYSPRQFLQYLDPESSGIDTSGRTITVPDSGLKRLDEGSTQALVNNSRYLLGNVLARTQNRIAKNKASRALYEYVKANPGNPLGARLAPAGMDKAPGGFTAITHMQDGAPRAILMPNELARYWVRHSPELNGQTARVLGWVSGAVPVRAMATGYNPEFALSNIPRDMTYYWLTTGEYSSFMPIAIAQQARNMLKVLPDVVRRTGRVVDYTKDGGSMEFLVHQGALLERSPWNTPEPVVEAVGQLQKVVGWLGETSELMGRMALREQAIRNGKTPRQATWAARDALDFSQGGSFVKMADKGIPYLNAAVQAGRGLFRQFKTSPALATFKAAQIMGVASALAYWNRERNKDAWESISVREKESNWIITTPFTYKDTGGNKRHLYFRIPKDQGARVFSAIGETLTEKAHGQEVDGQQIRMAAGDISPVGVRSSLPPTISALLGYATNKDFWRNEDIWKGRKVPPAQEFTADTPPAYVQLGEATGISPERTKYAVSRVIPYNPWTAIMGEAWNVVSPDDDAVNKIMAQRITELPFARRIVRLTAPLEIDREDRNAAKRMGVKTEENGAPRPPRAILKDLKAAELTINSERQKNDVAQDKLLAKIKSGAADDADMREWMRGFDSIDERDRLRQRYREKTKE